jgi:Uma2 family endonuclease
MSPIGSRHAMCVIRLTRSLVREVGDVAIVSVRNPVKLDERTEPQPDLTLIRDRDYRESLPMPEDVLLLIEVSDTTLAYDRGVKLPLYPRAGIQEVWIVDDSHEVVERHTDPSGDGYRRIERARRRETIESVALPELILGVDTVLGSSPR